MERDMPQASCSRDAHIYFWWCWYTCTSCLTHMDVYSNKCVRVRMCDPAHRLYFMRGLYACKSVPSNFGGGGAWWNTFFVIVVFPN